MRKHSTLRPKTLGRLVFAALLVTSMTVQAQTGPVGWWKFDEGTGTTAVDSSGGGHNGTLTGSPTWSTGRIGSYAITFNGTTQSVAVSGSGTLANLYSSGMTVVAWINPVNGGGGAGGRIVDKDNNDQGWFFSMDGATTVKFTSDQFSGTSPSRSSATPAIVANTWQHVAATWDGSMNGSGTNGAGIHIYINGVESTDGTVANGGGGAAYDDSTTPLTIGNRPTDNARGFNGSVDDVRVYNRVLSAAEIQALADSTAPAAPSGLTATAASSSQVNLTWTAPTDNVGVTGYLVERCLGGTGCSTFTQIATPTATNYSDTGLTASTAYTYRVRATDANSNLSGYSTAVSVATLASGGDTTPPSTLTGLAATAISSAQINLQWTASTDNVGVTGYSVERCTGLNCTTGFNTVGSPTTTSYSDTGLAPSTAYTYRVRAYDAAGNQGGYSNPTVSATTLASGDTQAPTAPTLSILAASSSEIDLNWSGSTDNVGVTGYFLDRCAGTGCTPSAFATPSGTPFFDTGTTPSTSYSYRIRASDAAGNLSSYSNVVTFTTPASSPDCN